MTPLYKFLKPNGTSVYTFPSSAEDISAQYQNSNYKMYFSKYVLLNIPKQNLNSGSGTQSTPTYFDFDTFYKSSNTQTITYKDALVESLRNYVANQEVVIKESKINNTSYYYDNNVLETTTEKIFWKWCKKLNIIDFEPAIGGDEYFSNLNEFKSKSPLDDEYFPEILWKERSTNPYEIKTATSNGTSGTLEVEFNGVTNFQIGDLIKLYNVSNKSIKTAFTGCDTSDGIRTKVVSITPPSGNVGQTIIFDIDASNLPSSPTNPDGKQVEKTGKMVLVYHKLVRYVGEVNGVSNVQNANRNYTEVYAHIPAHTGETPDILFRTLSDINYKPNLEFPILPSQIQPEIMGADSFESPIVNNNQNYPGSYYGQFDTSDFTYRTSTGDVLRRSGDYFGIKGDINNPVINGKTIDGLSVDFETNHYVKMNIMNNVVTNFDQFNAMTINNEPPKDFEYNAILWYYTVDNGTDSKTNLYGISFLDNPDNNVIDSEIGLRFPLNKKLVANGKQDGTSYAHNLNLNFNIINDNSTDTYNPDAINSLFQMNAFNKAMSGVSLLNDSFMKTIAEQDNLKTEILNIKQLLYTQTDLNTINTKIKSLENLLRLYATNQLSNSDTIEVTQTQSNPALLTLNNIDTSYTKIDNINTSDLYNATGIIPMNINVPKNKNFLINITNNDTVEVNFKNINDRLTIVLDNPLYFKQTCEIIINSLPVSTENKKLDIYFNDDIIGNTLLIDNIDLPIYFNTKTNQQNTNYKWKDFNFNIDFTQDIKLDTKDILSLKLVGDVNIISNSIKEGDTFMLNNLHIGTSSVVDYSGQYEIDTVVGNELKFNISKNVDLGNLYNTTPTLHSNTLTYLSNLPTIELNKGYKIKITKINDKLNNLTKSDFIILVEKL